MASIVRSLPSYVNTHSKFFAISISWAKTNLLLKWILRLFTVIPNGKGLPALKHMHFFDLHTVKESSSKILLRLVELVIKVHLIRVFLVAKTNLLVI